MTPRLQPHQLPDGYNRQAEIERALAIAGRLIDAGIPVFVANSNGNGTFRHPKGWQTTKPDRAVLNTWREGDALCAVMGTTVDALDIDVQNGGDRPAQRWVKDGVFPRSLGRQRTPSGGTHDLIAPLGLGSRDGFVAGIDLKGGRPDGQGRGMVYIAPTVKASKTTGELLAYRWEVEPNLAPLLAGQSDESTAFVAGLVRAALAGSKGTGTAAERPTKTAASIPQSNPADPLPDDAYTAGTRYERAAVRGCLQDLLDLPRPWSPGAGWDRGVFERACNLFELANLPFTTLTPEQVETLVALYAPRDDVWTAREVREKVESARSRIGTKARRNVPLEVVGAATAQAADDQDTFEEAVRSYVETGYDKKPNEQAVKRVIRSAWSDAQPPAVSTGAPKSGRSDANSSTGYLVSDGGVLRVLCQGGKDSEPYTLPWGDFDIKSQGTVVEDNGRVQAYLAMLYTVDSAHSVIFTPELLSDDRKLRAFLASFGASYSDPAPAQPRMVPGVRLLRFLKTHSPGTARVADHLGYDQQSDAFVTFSGVIREDGHHNGWEDGIRVVADPRLLELGAKFEYGFDTDEATARGVLREVMTWHDEPTMAVFVSWWAACFLKPQALKCVSLFPFMALEAASGSAKTTGAFGDLIQLSGSNAGHELFTTASFRDKVSANRSGIVWNDDADDLSALEEILRGATMGVTLNKKRNDNTTTAQVSLVAPIVISGEGLGLEGQKALVDRAVILNPPPVSERRSLRDSSRKQWDDIQEFHAKHGNLTRYAGWMVRLALQHSDEFVRRLTEARRLYAGRYGDNLAVITAGAWLADEMAQTGTWAQDRAAAWCRAKDGSYLSGENSLTDDLIPWALQQFGLHEWVPGTRAPAVLSFGQDVAPGVMFSRGTGTAGADDRTLWINTARLAHLYESYHRGNVPERTHTARALAGQISAVTGPKTEARKVSVVGGQQEFRPLLPAYTRRILAKHEGGGEDNTGGSTARATPRSTPLELDGLAHDDEQ